MSFDNVIPTVKRVERLQYETLGRQRAKGLSRYV